MRPQNNARLETANQKPMFHDSFRARHCLVLADSFYEWKTVGTHKQPYRIMLKTGEPFAMAGIYARSDDHEFGQAESAPVTFAILTTAANEIMRLIHERMPVILPLGREKNWLPPNPSGMFVSPPFPSELMTAYPVSPKVNRASFNEPEATTPLVVRVAALTDL
jgi:putative SOS response-associated peptidase YedK